MARYKSYNYAQMKLVAVSYERQILPGTFEHTLNHLIDHDIDLAPFAALASDNYLDRSATIILTG
jgi:hypothetical protein